VAGNVRRLHSSLVWRALYPEMSLVGDALLPDAIRPGPRRQGKSLLRTAYEIFYLFWSQHFPKNICNERSLIIPTIAGECSVCSIIYTQSASLDSKKQPRSSFTKKKP